MELSGDQIQKIVDAVITRMRRGVDQGESDDVSVDLAGASTVVQLPPEFYESQCAIAAYLARHDGRFEQVDLRFAQVEKRFEQVDKRFPTMQWTMSVGFMVITVLVSVYNFVG